MMTDRTAVRAGTLLVGAVVTAMALVAVGGAAPAVAAGVGTGSTRVAPMVTVPGTSGVTAGTSRPVVLSANWSGYAATSKTKFDEVAGEFTQPSIVCNGVGGRYVAVWTGLDGFTDSTVEQDGTFATCTGPGHRVPAYVAWYEMYPLPSVDLFSVNAGDRIASSVTYAGGSFTLTLSDETTHQTGTFSAPCTTCRRSSAEWIIERPELCNKSQTSCFLSELPDFGTATVASGSAGTDGSSPGPLSSFANTPIDMDQPVGSSVELLDQTSALNASGTSFSTVWERAGKRLFL